MICRRFPIPCAWPSRLSMRTSPTKEPSRSQPNIRMGLSMGGYGTWDAIQRRPDFFAAAVPICGGGDKISGRTQESSHLGMARDKDRVIKPSRSRDMIEAIRRRVETQSIPRLKDADTILGPTLGIPRKCGTGSILKKKITLTIVKDSRPSSGCDPRAWRCLLHRAQVLEKGYEGCPAS